MLFSFDDAAMAGRATNDSVDVVDGGLLRAITILQARTATAPARVILDQIISQSDEANRWFLGGPSWLPEDGWALYFEIIQPDKDLELDRTPLPVPGR